MEISFVPGGQINIALLLNRVLRAVAVGIVARVVEQRVDRLIAVQIDDAEMLSLRDLVNPGFARWNHMAVDRVGRIEFAFDQILAGDDGCAHGCPHRKYRSVSVNPRPFSGRETRHGSSAAGG